MSYPYGDITNYLVLIRDNVGQVAAVYKNQNATQSDTVNRWQCVVTTHIGEQCVELAENFFVRIGYNDAPVHDGQNVLGLAECRLFNLENDAWIDRIGFTVRFCKTNLCDYDRRLFAAAMQCNVHCASTH